MKNVILFSIYFLFNFFISVCPLQKAVICVSIADLTGQPLYSLDPYKTVEQIYSSIPVCGVNNSLYSCARLHQLLYNEIVEVIRFTDNEACIKVMNSYYSTDTQKAPQSNYWTLKKNIILLSDIQNHIDQSHIPTPINFQDKTHDGIHAKNTITLNEPHHDEKLQCTFSAGTRFISAAINHKQRICDTYAIDYKNMKELHIKIPRHKCIIFNENTPQEERINNFITILKKWAHNKKGFIPYVWGGTSYTYTLKSPFKESTHVTPNGNALYYEYEKDIHYPKSGLDCSGLILRAAQLCGIPYFYKNSTVLAQSMEPLQSQDILSNGDIIFIKGHVMVVSDIQKNLLIEARGYSHGYGKVHEIPLSTVFEGINTYKDLTDAFFQKKIIRRKDNKEIIRDSFGHFQLFPLKNVWKNNSIKRS